MRKRVPILFLTLLILTLVGCKWPWEDDDDVAVTEPPPPLAVGAALDLKCEPRTRPLVRCDVVSSGIETLQKTFKVAATGQNDEEFTTTGDRWSVEFDFTDACAQLAGGTLRADFSASATLEDDSSVKASPEQHQVCVTGISTLVFTGSSLTFDAQTGEIANVTLEASLEGLRPGETFTVIGSKRNDGTYTAAAPSTVDTIFVAEQLTYEASGAVITLQEIVPESK